MINEDDDSAIAASAVESQKALDTADMSKASEQDATVSVSASGSERDDFVDDSQSVTSDAFSTQSKVSARLHSSKQLAYKVNKLKEENALLRKNLEKFNTTDITALRTKLRISTVDVTRLKQHNAELRDRVQILESRLFSALQNQSRGAGAIGGDAGDGAHAATVSEKLFHRLSQKRVAFEQSRTDYLRGNSDDLAASTHNESAITKPDSQTAAATDVNSAAAAADSATDRSSKELLETGSLLIGSKDQEIMSLNESVKMWQSKAKHWSRLAKGYEERIALMQVCW